MCGLPFHSPPTNLQIQELEFRLRQLLLPRVVGCPGVWGLSGCGRFSHKQPRFMKRASVLGVGKDSWPCESKLVNHEVTKLLWRRKHKAFSSHRCTNLISCPNISCSPLLKRNICIHLSSSLPFISKSLCSFLFPFPSSSLPNTTWWNNGAHLKSKLRQFKFWTDVISCHFKST